MILPVNSELVRSSLTRTVRPLPEEADAGHELWLPELWRMLRSRRVLILGCIAAGVLLSALYVLVRSPRYDANARIEVSPTGTNSMGLEDLPAKMLNPLDSTIQLQSAATILQSKTVALAVMQQMKLHERKDFAGRWTQPAGTAVANLSPEARDELLLRFNKALKVEIVPKTDIIDVQFRAKDPRLASDVVNATVSSYTERNFHSSYDSAAQVSRWLSSQMDDLRAAGHRCPGKAIGHAEGTRPDRDRRDRQHRH